MPSDPSKRLQLIVDEKWKKRVKAWASKVPDKPNLSEAIRRLVDIALHAQSVETELKKRERKK